MPARHTSLQDGPLLEAVFDPAALVDERGCRRDIRSNGWIVLSRSSLFENRSGRRNKFSSFGADLWSAISSGPKPAVKSGPDVFADALVPKTPHAGVSEDAPCGVRRRIGVLVLQIPHILFSPPAASGREGSSRRRSSRTMRCGRRHWTGRRRRRPLALRRPIAANGYRFAKWQGKPNSAFRRKAPLNQRFCDFTVTRGGAGVHLRFIPIFKLPFKFDRS